MTVDYSRIQSLTVRQIATALVQDGFGLTRQRGSNRRCHHPDGRRVTLAFHHGDDTFPIRTLKSIIEDQARWSEDDLNRLGLLALLFRYYPRVVSVRGDRR